MRSAVIAIVVFLLLGGVFAAFMFLQAPTPDRTTVGGPGGATTRAALPPPPPSTRQSESVVGAASDVWIQSFDKNTGALVSEFKAARYDPPQGGIVHVFKPEARFHMKDGSVLTVNADGGDVVMPDQTRKSESITSIEAQPPTRGVLTNVTIGMLKDADADEPSLTVSIPVVEFDNDTLRMNTVQTQIDGRDVLADRVPVTVRGKDYDFDGEGLIVRYNQRDQRLEYLEITHGKRLIVKNANAFGTVPLPKASGTKPTSMRWRTTGDQLASADPADAAKLAAEERERRERKRRRAAATRPVVPKEVVAYRALFERDVRISEADKPIGSAERLMATFTFVEGPDEAAPAERRARAATQPVADATAATQPVATQPVARRAKAAPAASASGDIEITWAGKLTVTPVEMEKSGLRSPADRVVEFVGSPVKLERDSAMIEAASVAVGAVGNRFIARSNEKFPTVKLRDPTGMVLTTAALDFSGDEAVIQGQSSAELVIAAAEKDQPAQKLLTTWRDKATLRLVTSDDGKRAIDRAVFEGAVDVQHPQLKLRSDALALSFAAVAGRDQPALSSADASGSVNATITDDKGATQTITANQLKLATEPQKDGSLLLKQLDAGGDVVAQDAKQKILADQLSVTLSAVAGADAKAAKIDVEKMTAQGRVTFTSAEGSTAKADMITVRRQGEGQLVELMGQPAVVQDKESKLSGKLIRLDTLGGGASVVGAGSIAGLARANGDAKPTPVEVSWSQSLDYRAADNRADVVGDVVIVSVGKDGAIDRATGRQMTLLLADAAAKAQPAAPQPAAAPAPGFGGGGKQVKSITLEGEVEISSLLYSPTNVLLRRVHAFAPAVTVQTQPGGELGAVTIPSAGRMLYEDRQQAAATTQPADAGPVVKGAIAIEWQKQLVYDPSTLHATLEGDVVVVQKDPGGEPLRMTAQRLVAQLNESAGDGAQIKQVVADQGASFSTSKVRFDAAEAIYEPGNERVIARGTPRQPVQLYDENGATNGSFEEIWWNIKAGRPERLKNVSANVRQ